MMLAGTEFGIVSLSPFAPRKDALSKKKGGAWLLTGTYSELIASNSRILQGKTLFFQRA